MHSQKNLLDERIQVSFDEPHSNGIFIKKNPIVRSDEKTIKQKI